MVNHDKVFASLWISHNEVIMGTKCNKLVIVNTDNMKTFEIPLINGRTSATLNETSDNEQPLRVPSNCTGIHGLAVNPSGTLLAVGAGNPVEVTIYRLPSFEMLAVMTGHTDMVFSIAWINDDILVSGSRDTSIRVWSVSSPAASTLPLLGMMIGVREPLLDLKEHKNKVRDLKYNRMSKKILSLSTEGCVKLWDSALFSMSKTIPLNHTTETVTIGMNEAQDLYAVGSLDHISVIDPRMGSVVHEIPSQDDNWGIRSLSFDEHIITAGGGMGRISFYDLRRQKYLELPRLREPYHQTGHGWLNHDSTYTNLFQGVAIYNAVYTLGYNPSGTKLFAAGGPLQLGLCGSYAAVFS